MKLTTHLTIYIGVALFINCASSRAADWRENLYLHTDIGPAFIGNGPTTFRGVFPSTGFFQGKGHFQADAGIRGDLALGYHLTKSWAVEVESGAIWNQGPNPDDSFYQIPVMLNVVYEIHVSDSWKAYIGAGGGGVVSMISSEFKDPALHTPFLLEDSDWSPGYQAEAGIKYAISRHVEVDLGYKFLGVVEYNYRLGPIPAAGEFLKVNDLFTHSGTLSLIWKF
jgi:opacity protein-like surface antigen